MSNISFKLNPNFLRYITLGTVSRVNLILNYRFFSLHFSAVLCSRCGLVSQFFPLYGCVLTSLHDDNDIPTFPLYFWLNTKQGDRKLKASDWWALQIFLSRYRPHYK